MTADSLPPCWVCGGECVYQYIDDRRVVMVCDVCGRQRQQERKHHTVATAPWTRDLWAEVELARQERDQLRAALAEVLDCFMEHVHPGKDCQRTGWIDVETVNRWRSLLSPSGREGQAGNEEEGR